MIFGKDNRLLVHVQTGTARIHHFHDFLPSGVASVGYFHREFYKACSRPRRSLAQSRVLVPITRGNVARIFASGT